MAQTMPWIANVAHTFRLDTGFPTEQRVTWALKFKCPRVVRVAAMVILGPQRPDVYGCCYHGNENMSRSSFINFKSLCCKSSQYPDQTLQSHLKVSSIQPSLNASAFEKCKAKSIFRFNS